MRPAAPLLAALALLVPALAFAQAGGLKGRFADVSTKAAVPGVAVRLTAESDTSFVRRVTAKDDGTFAFTGLPFQSYRLEATRLGYAPLKKTFAVTKADQDAGALELTPQSVPVAGITVTESPAPAVVRDDTTEFRASAVKVHKDATAEELVQKMPGVTLENGQVKAQGEQVRNVLVNGRPFFGSDPTAAMRNLPAEVVDRIQVYDRMSDQAEFSGFDDGSSEKTMNFILRDQKATFGKVYGGGGDQELYQAGGNFTALRGASRLSLIGMSNNVNQKNFSHQDLFGAMSGQQGGGGPRIMMMHGGRPPGGGNQQIVRMGGGGGGSQFDPGSFLVGQQAGVATTHAGGTNYNGQWGSRLQVNASLFANDADTDNRQTLARQYLPAQDSLAFYDQRSVSNDRNGNQRFDARIEWKPDSLNSVIFSPRLYFQQSDALNGGEAANVSTLGSLLGRATSDTREQVDGNNLSSRLTLRRRFAKRGRNVSADLSAGSTLRDGESEQRSFTDYYEGTTVTSSDTLDQQGGSRTRTRTFSTRIAFTEPLAPGLQAQLIYNPSVTSSTSDARTFGRDGSGAYTLPESTLSNSYESRTTAQNGGLAMLWTRGPWKLLTNASYQSTRLRSEQTFPESRLIERTFGDVLPSVTLTGNFANRRNLRLAWNTSTDAPSIRQLQNVVNNSNPLALTTGNPALRPSYRHTVSLRFNEADPQRSRSRFVFANVTRTSRPIVNSIFVAPADTTLDGIALARGTQLTRPVNGDEPSWNANLFGVYSRPTPWVKTIWSLNGGGSFTRTPTYVGHGANLGDTWALRAGTVLASNISQNLDFNVSYQGTYNLSRNSQTTGTAGDYYTHSLGVRFNAVAPRGIVIRQEVSHALQSGVPSAYGQDVVLWNTTLGKKFLKNDRGEFRVTATDVLAQNRSVSRNVTETYVQDQRDLALGRYVQAVFTYSFR